MWERTYHHDDLGFGPFSVHSLDDLGERVNVSRGRDVVGGVLVVGADIDYHDVGGRVSLEVPWFRVIWPVFVSFWLYCNILTRQGFPRSIPRTFAFTSLFLSETHRRT
jgi:hypothetical protein